MQRVDAGAQALDVPLELHNLRITARNLGLKPLRVVQRLLHSVGERQSFPDDAPRKLRVGLPKAIDVFLGACHTRA